MRFLRMIAKSWNLRKRGCEQFGVEDGWIERGGYCVISCMVVDGVRWTNR